MEERAENEFLARQQLAQLNSKQKQVVDIYRKYLAAPETCRSRPPPVVLLTGKGGTGKSFVIRTIMSIGRSHGNVPWMTANNNLNAADIDGCTIASLLCEGFEEKRNEPTEKTKKRQRVLKEAAVTKLMRSSQAAKVPLLIIDEASNISADKLARLSQLFAAVRNKKDEIFGGMPVLLVGDYNQKPPIGGILATADLMGHVTNAARNYKCSKTTSSGKTKGRPIKSNAIFADSSHSAASNSAIGSRILASAKWLELTEAERSKDKEHNAFVDKLYEGKQISLDKDLKKYDLWDKETVEKDSVSERRKYLSAPVIVKTNREQFTMNILRAH